jgi:CRP/FNR family transcriptional regulator, cyclic AMP receptor protein
LLLTDVIALAEANLRATLSSPEQIVAVVSVVIAGGLIVVSSFVKTMIPLRWLGVGGNIGFLIYGALRPSIPMLLLHATLLPINIVRAVEMVRMTRRVKASASADIGIWLKPYMMRTKHKNGDVLFRKDDPAGHLYFLVEGRVEVVEIGVFIEPNTMFGEIAFFAPDKRRTNTARCVGPCTVLSIDESTVNQLYYQNPDFGFQLMALVAGRLTADVQRLQKQVAQAKRLEAGGPPGSEGSTPAGPGGQA